MIPLLHHPRVNCPCIDMSGFAIIDARDAIVPHAHLELVLEDVSQLSTPS